MGSVSAAERFAFDPAGNLLPELPGSSSTDNTSSSGVLHDNRLRVYQDVQLDYDVHGNVTTRLRGNQSAGTHGEARLQWNSQHQLVQAQVSRHGVTQTTAYVTSGCKLRSEERRVGKECSS